MLIKNVNRNLANYNESEQTTLFIQAVKLALNDNII